MKTYNGIMKYPLASHLQGDYFIYDANIPFALFATTSTRVLVA